MGAENQVNVTGRDLGSEEEEFMTAITQFISACEDNESCLSSLTGRGFTGTLAEKFMNSYNSKLQPKLDEIRKKLSNYREYIEEETEEFARLNKKGESVLDSRYH